MFKASIALVLLAFGALAYGWIAGNDAVLYGSIGASALAGMALLGSHMADRGSSRSAEPKRGRAEKRDRERKVVSDEPLSKASDGGKGRRLGAGGITRQLDLDEDDDLSNLAPPTVRPIVTPPRKRQPKIPEGAAWATRDDFSDEGLDPDYEREQADYEAGFQQEEREEYAAEEAQSTPSYRQGAAAADDFRSRLAAVLGQPGDSAGDDFEEPAPAPAPKPARARRVTQVPAPAAEVAKPPARRGRKKAEPAVAPPEASEGAPAEEGEPEWIRLEDVPRIARATQPGGGFARPDPPQGVTPYRPRRPAVAKPPEPDVPAKAAAPRRRSTTPTSKTTAAKPGAGKTSSAKSSVSRVSPGAPDKPDAEAPKPRRGRPPKPKP